MEQLSKEWFEIRKSKITASSVGGILGLSPFVKRADVMRRMVRDALGAEPEFKGNVATFWGQSQEAGALIDYRLETGHEVKPASFVVYDDGGEWLGASPDGYVNELGLIEIKAPFGIRKDKNPVFKTAKEQPHYWAQMQIQMLVTKRSWVDFYQWTPFATKTERIFPDKAWQDKNIPILRQFYAEFLDEVKSGGKDHLAPKRVVIDTPEAHKMIAELDELNEQLENAASRKKDLIADMAAMAGGKNADFAGRKLTQVERAGSVAYAKVVKEHLPKMDLEPYRGKPTSYWQIK